MASPPSVLSDDLIVIIVMLHLTAAHGSRRAGPRRRCCLGILTRHWVIDHVAGVTSSVLALSSSGSPCWTPATTNGRNKACEVCLRRAVDTRWWWWR